MYVVNLVHRTGCYFLKIEETHKVKKKSTKLTRKTQFKWIPPVV